MAKALVAKFLCRCPLKILHESAPVTVLLMRRRTVGLMTALMAARLEDKLGMVLKAARPQAEGLLRR